jgi:succinylglutamate desuccinylase
MHFLKRVLIVGGTHGNELTGIYLVKKFARSPELITRSSFESLTLFANPAAYALGKRYVDTDLNRCFQAADLANPHLIGYEPQRAKEICQQFGNSSSQPVDLVVDLHSTTANMGLTLILSSRDAFILQLVSYLRVICPRISILYSRTAYKDNYPHLDSIGKFSCTIEVGAIGQGVLKAALFQQTEALVLAILDFVEAYNQQISLPQADNLTIYKYLTAIDYPRNEFGDIIGIIHPQLQDRDYQPLHPGDPLFWTFDGEVINYQGGATVYPVFINEAAYYEKAIALLLTQKEEIVTPKS